MKKIGMMLAASTFFTFTAVTALGQNVGDFRSATVGNWSSTATWQTWDGGGWVAASSTPTGSSVAVYLDSTATVTLTQDESCGDLHLHSNTSSPATAQRLKTQNFTVSVNGKIRGFRGAAPGSNSTSFPSSVATPWINTTGGGKIRIVGSTRNITNSGQWASNPPGWRIEIALSSSSDTARLGTGMKAAIWIITSGILAAGNNTVSADSGASGTGRITVASGATLSSAQSATSNPVIQRTGTTPAASLAVDGTLVLTGTSPRIAASSIDFTGTVEYARGSAQTLADSLFGGAQPLTYTNLKLSGTGTKTTLANISTSIAAGGSLEMSGGSTPPTLAIGSGATFSVSSTSTTIVYTATGAQTTGIEWDPNFQNAAIVNLAGVTLSESKTISGVLLLGLGTLSTGSDSITVTNTALGAVISLGSGNVDGTITRSLTATSTGTYVFTGGNAQSGQMSIVFSGGTANPTLITVRVNPNTFPPAGDNTKTVKRTWTITQDGGGTFSATVNLSYEASEINGTEASYNIWRKATGGQYVDQGNNGLNMSTHTISLDMLNVTDFSDFAVAEAGAGLPIQLSSFSASVIRDNDVEITWHTVSETNNYGFEIQRKRGEQGDWSNIAFVEGHGTTLTPQSYSYIDRLVSFGKYHYRIRQVDLDGKSETFAPMEVSVGAGPDKFVLTQNYPNPFNPSTLIEFVVPQSGFTTLKVYNVLGQEVAKLFEESAEAGKIYSVRFSATGGSAFGGDASNLSSGIYFYQLAGAGRIETKRMLLLR